VELLQKIREIRKEASETDEKVAGLRDTTKEKPFLAKMMGSGKALLLDSSKNFKLRKVDKLCTSFGRLLLQSKDDIPPGAYLNDYRANRKKQMENAASAKSITVEQAAIEEELRELGVEKRFRKRIKDLEIQNEKNASRLSELFLLTGQELYKKRKDFDDGNAVDFIDDIENCLQRNAEYTKEKKKLEAAIEYDNLTRKIHSLREKLESEEEAIKAHKSNTEKIKKDIAEAEKDRSRAEKTSREGERQSKNGGNRETKHS